MARAKASGTAPCVHCGGTSLRKNGHKSGHQRWSCPDCGKSFTETYGTPMYRLRHDPAEVAQSLQIVMRRGSLSAAEEIAGHNWMHPPRALREADPDPSTGRRCRPRSPVMALGLSDHLWSWTEFLSKP